MPEKIKQIKIVDRASGQIIEEQTPSSGFLRFLYQTHIGRLPLYFFMKRKLVSSVLGVLMNTRFSSLWVPKFINKHEIDMDEAQLELKDYKSFNEFFYRKLNTNARPIEEGIVSPADGKVLAFAEIDQHKEFFIKGSKFCLEEFIQDKTTYSQFESGSMLIIRLAPTDYHRFHFPAEGKASESKLIKGHYYSVSPLALKKSLRIFCENKRTYSILETKNSGNILISEVGATLVGSILQTYETNSTVSKGQEKGYFAFGGSTLVLLFEKGKVKIAEDIIENTKKGFETTVRMGENIAL